MRPQSISKKAKGPRGRRAIAQGIVARVLHSVQYACPSDGVEALSLSSWRDESSSDSVCKHGWGIMEKQTRKDNKSRKKRNRASPSLPCFWSHGADPEVIAQSIVTGRRPYVPKTPFPGNGVRALSPSRMPASRPVRRSRQAAGGPAASSRMKSMSRMLDGCDGSVFKNVIR